MGLDPAAMGGRTNIAEPVVIWPDMRDGFVLFCAMGTQWRWTAVGHVPMQVGLDYGVMLATASSLNLELTERGQVPPAVFSDVRALEAEALATWARRRK